MAKIFLDVGGFRGDSALAALDPRFAFDRVYCFEPVGSCFTGIVARLSDPRLQVVNAGLLDRNEELPIYHAGSLGGSVYADAPDVGGLDRETCRFIRATDFFREHISAGSQVWMKLNCEGAECDVLLDLLDSGEAVKLTEVLLDLDARKIPSAQGKLQRLTDRLEDAPFSYHFPEEVQYTMVTNYGGIRNWLIVTGALEPGWRSFFRSLIYQHRPALDPTVNGYYKIRLLRALKLREPAGVPTRPHALIGRAR
jgi:FkbM family methyltransferase